MTQLITNRLSSHRRSAVCAVAAIAGLGVFLAASLVAGAITDGAGLVNVAHAQVLYTSHLKLTSTAGQPPPSIFVDPVINNSIEVEITIRDPFMGCCGGTADSGTLTLTPGATPNWAWNCTYCTNLFFVDVTACSQAGGCSVGDVRSWLIGVEIDPNAGLGSSSYVKYEIDSANLGNGKRYDVARVDCNTTATPVTSTYSATDGKQGWDANTPCSDNGVSINLDYQ